MGRTRSLRNQLNYVVCQSKRLGHSKRGERKNGTDVESYLYSLNSTKKMFAFCHKFSDWMKVHYPHIRWVRDIKPKHFNEFCEENQDHWTNATRKEYQSRIHKLGKMVSRVYKIKRDYTMVEVKLKNQRDKQKNPPMSKADYQKLQKTLSSKTTFARFLPDIVYRIGARSEEARSIRAEDIDLKANRIYLNNCKNGKKRSVPIRKRDIEFFRKLKNIMIEEGWSNTCNGISENACNNAIRSAMKECGISETYKRQSLHAIRKLYAGERMKEEYNKGFNKRTSWEHIQKELGHGSRFRGELFHIYIGQYYEDWKAA